MVVVDDVLPDPLAYRQVALAGPFRDVSLGPDLTFHGIQLTDDDTFPGWIRQRFPHLAPALSFFRQSPLGQVEPNYVHTDRDMGDWTALLYLNPHPLAGDGTTFWRHRASGAIGSEASDSEALLEEQLAWRDLSQWEPVGQIAAKFGRALLFPSDRFHSRAILENYGTGDDARLVQVVFGIGAL